MSSDIYAMGVCLNRATEVLAKESLYQEIYAPYFNVETKEWIINTENRERLVVIPYDERHPYISSEIANAIYYCLKAGEVDRY